MLFEVYIPRWVNYIAQDRSGSWYGYLSKPKKTDWGWEAKTQNSHEWIMLVEDGVPPADFNSELYKVTWRSDAED